MNPVTHRTLTVLLALTAAALPPPAFAQSSWQVTRIQPGVGGTALGVRDGLIVGSLSPRSGLNFGAMWTIPSLQRVDLHPAELADSIVVAVSGTQQVGTTAPHGIFSGRRAALWNNSALGYVSLQPPGAESSDADDVWEGRQVGSAVINGVRRAGMWSGTAESWVALTPPGALVARALAIHGDRQGGLVVTEAGTAAALWSGSAESWVNLHPAGYSASMITALHGERQFGRTYLFDGTISRPQAAMWSGSAASHVDLNPPGAAESSLEDAFGDFQAGYAMIGGVPRAGVWSGSAASWEALPLPSGVAFTSSSAWGVWSTPTTAYIVGFAMTGAGVFEHPEPLLWTRTIPAPSTAAPPVFVGILAASRRRR